MAIGLREIAQHAPAQWIELFGEQAHIVAAREQALEEAAGFRIAPLQYVIVGEPKTAGQEGSLASGQAVGGVSGFVAANEFPPDQKPVLDCSKRPAHARIAGRQKADQGDQQQTRIEALRAVGLDKAVEAPVETLLADLGMDFVRDFPPSLPCLV